MTKHATLFAETTIEVIPSFHEADPLGVVWHGNYLKYFERAREVLFRALHYDYQTMRETGYAWPVIHVDLDYRRAMVVESPYRVWVGIVEIENRLVTRYQIREGGLATESPLVGAQVLTERRPKGLIAVGEVVQMAMDIHTREGQVVSPKILFEKLGVPYPWEA